MNMPTQNSSEIFKFKTQSIATKGLILQNRKNEEQYILFSEVKKVYIKKNKLSWLSKSAYLLLFTLLISIATIFLPIEFVMLSSILWIPLIAKLNAYKSYEIHMMLNDGKLYKKMFYLCNKQEHINLVNKVKNQIFECQIKSNLQYKTAYIKEKITADYSNMALSIA